MTVHNDKSHTIADDTAAMISNTAAPAAPATYWHDWHGRPLDDVRQRKKMNSMNCEHAERSKERRLPRSPVTIALACG